jgi:hypothetical protein
LALGRAQVVRGEVQDLSKSKRRVRVVSMPQSYASKSKNATVGCLTGLALGLRDQRDQHRRPISPLVARRVPNEDLLSSAALRRSSSSASLAAPSAHLPICPVCPICRALAAPLQSRLSQAQPIEGVCTTHHIPLCTVPRHRCGTVPSLAPPLRRPAVGTSTPSPQKYPTHASGRPGTSCRSRGIHRPRSCARPGSSLRVRAPPICAASSVLGWRGCSWEPLDTRNIHNRTPIQSHGCFDENYLPPHPPSASPDPSPHRSRTECAGRYRSEKDQRYGRR